MNSETTVMQSEMKPVASYWHSLIFLGILVVVVIAGYAAQHRPTSGGDLLEAHAHVIPMYISLIAMNWLLLFFAWRGIRRNGGTLRSLIGGRWATGREIFRDMGIAVLFWGIFLLTDFGMGRLLGYGHEKSLNNLFPQTPLEVGVWFLVSVTAGFCEELVFRGYVQSQLLALSRRTWIAIIGQACIFGLFHAYQGWRPVVTITVLGALFGILAAWRKTLRIGMIAHGWQDFWGGWLGYVILR
jgi:uncharacterized protein